MFRLTAAMTLFLGLTALPAFAADGDVDVNPSGVKLVIATPAPLNTNRPAALPVLYGSLVGLQAYDLYSTHQGLSRGAQESNPLMQGVVGNSTTVIVTKAASTAVTIAIAERLWKTNKAAAIVTMIVANGVMGAVAANNARVLQQIH
jgi:hypothetical protein